MASFSTSWGDSGPTITINVSTVDYGSYVTYDWNLVGNSNYNYGTSYAAPWVCSTPTGYYTSDTYGKFSINSDSVLCQDSGKIDKTSDKQTLNFSATVTSWGGLNWNKISGDYYESCKTASGSIPIEAIYTADVPEILESTEILRPEDSFTVQWSGSTSGANSLNLIITDQNDRTLVTKKNISTSVTSKSFSLSGIRAKRGDKLYARLHSDPDSQHAGNSSYDTLVATVNTLPSKPKVTQSKTEIRGRETIEFDVVPGIDSDKQELTTYYRVNESGWQTLSGTKLVVSLKTNGIIKEQENYIYFRTDDPLEQGESEVKSFLAIGKPEFSSIPSIKYTSIKSESNVNLVKDAQISFSLMIEQNNPKIQVLYVVSDSYIENSDSLQQKILGEAYYSYDTRYSRKDINIDIANISQDAINYGQYFDFKIKIYGESLQEDDVVISPWLGQARRSYLPRLPAELSDMVVSDIPPYEQTNYFKNSFTVNCSIPNDASGYAPYTTFQIVARKDDGKEYLKELDLGTIGLQSKTFSEGIDKALPGDPVYIDIRVEDKAGQIAQMTLKKVMYKASGLNFLKDTVTVNPVLVRPLSALPLLEENDIFTVIFAPAKAVGAKKVDYIFTIELPMEDPGDHKYQLLSENYNLVQDTSQNINTLTMTGEVVRAIFKQKLTNTKDQRNRLYQTVNFIIKASDDIGNTDTITGTFQADFREKPIWPEGQQIKVYHSYDLGNESIMSGPIKTYNISNAQEDLDLRMFNAKENVTFSIPIPLDPNEDINDIKFYLSVNDFTEMVNTEEVSKVVFEQTPWQEVKIKNLQKTPTGEYLFTSDIPNYATNKYIYFKAIVFDSEGNQSEPKYSNTFIISCRTVSPAFSMGEVKFERIGDTTVKVNYNLQITDLGGSATKEGWNREYYERYRNFERVIPNLNYVPKIGLIVEIDVDPKFNTPNLKTQKIFHDFPSTEPNRMMDFTSSTSTFTNFIKTEKFYVRFTLIASYGINSLEQEVDYPGLAVIQSFPQIASYFGNVPTVAHRAHAVGINIPILNSNEAFSVGAYSNKNMVTFKGATYEVSLNMNTGELDGAVISGGSW